MEIGELVKDWPAERLEGVARRGNGTAVAADATAVA